MAKTTKKTTKRRKPKGKLVSERLAAKERARAELDEQGLDGEGEATDDDDEEPEGGLDDGDDVVDADFEDQPEDEPEDDDEDAEGDGVDGDDGDAEPGDEDEEDDEEGLAAAQMGHQRYVVAGFFGLWLVVGYILGRALEGAWAEAASRPWFLRNIPQLAAVEDEGALISRASISLVVGLVVGAAIVLRYYYKPEVRTWADEVAEQLNKVKWPTRKEVGNNTVVVMVSTAIITLYLTLLDRFWGFLTNLIYAGGA